MIGCTRPVSAGASRTGSVTSTLSVLSRASSAAPLSASRRAASAALTRSFRPLIAGPWLLRSSGDMRAERLEQRRDRAAFAERGDAHGFERRLVAGGGDCQQDFFFKLRDVGHRNQSGMNGRSVSDGRPPACVSIAMHLAAMMGLVIEHMRDQQPARPRPFALGRAGVVRSGRRRATRLRPHRPSRS